MSRWLKQILFWSVSGEFIENMSSAWMIWLTFDVLEGPGNHPWDHPGAPEGALGATLGHLRSQTKNNLTKQINFLRGQMEVSKVARKGVL